MAIHNLDIFMFLSICGPKWQKYKFLKLFSNVLINIINQSNLFMNNLQTMCQISCFLLNYNLQYEYHNHFTCQTGTVNFSLIVFKTSVWLGDYLQTAQTWANAGVVLL